MIKYFKYYIGYQCRRLATILANSYGTEGFFSSCQDPARWSVRIFIPMSSASYLKPRYILQYVENTYLLFCAHLICTEYSKIEGGITQ